MGVAVSLPVSPAVCRGDELSGRRRRRPDRFDSELVSTRPPGNALESQWSSRPLPSPSNPVEIAPIRPGSFQENPVR